MKKNISIILVALMIFGLFAAVGCGKEKKQETDMAALIVGDWYTYNGAPYRSFSPDGIVTGAENYSSPYTIEGDRITWNTSAGNEEVTLEFWTDGETLRISSNYGGYFSTRKYYCKSPEGAEPGTGMPKRGTTDKGIFGTWYSGAKLFFELHEDGTVSGRGDNTGFSFFGDEIVLFTGSSSFDEAAECSLEGDVLTIYCKDELTGEKAELVLTREPTGSADNVLDGLTEEEIFLPEEELLED